ncbi:MAG: hypothetical protein WC358_08350, partial [Ignavibacteria bacterium]
MKKNILQLIILVIILSFFVGCSAIKSSIQSKSMEVKKNIKLPLGGKIIIFNGIPDFSFKEGVKGSCSKEEIVNAGVEIGNYIAELVSKKLSSSINKNSFIKIDPIKTSTLPYKSYSFEFSKVLGTKMDGNTYIWKKNEYLNCNWENLVAASNRPNLYDSHSIKVEDIKEQ